MYLRAHRFMLRDGVWPGECGHLSEAPNVVAWPDFLPEDGADGSWQVFCGHMWLKTDDPIVRVFAQVHI